MPAAASVFPVLTPSATWIDDASGVGSFIQIAVEKPIARLAVAIGKPVVKRWTSCHRYEPFWMRPAAGDGQSIALVPIETQSLIAELPDNRVAVIIPLLDGSFRCSLEGNAAGELVLVAESDDPGVVTGKAVGAFVAVGEELYSLCQSAARAVMARMKTGRLREDKALPAFVEKFGWCTWDAFYQEVSHEKVKQGLESFKKGGVQPKALILDDGWQSVGPALPNSAKRLTAFAANEKFPGDLGATTQMARAEFGVEHFMVWHAFQGYWGGVDPASFPTFDVRPLPRTFCPGILHHMPNANEQFWGHVAGVVSTRDIYGFYQAYHRHLRLQGVDGVKVDNQSTSEGLAMGQGGRVRMLRKYHEALEGSVHTHFGGTLINCMSCGNDVLYQTLNSTLTRTSTDFWPKRPETHGLHLYTNAQVCLWFGNFVHGDWDMFQSGHEWGAFHAAGRAVSGSPVYVSDKPGEHNFDLLRKMVCGDGTVLRCDQPGLPTRDCVFADPTKDDVLFKIWNTNGNGRSGVVGVFNCRYAGDGATGPTLKGSISPADVPGLCGSEFAVHLHRAGTVTKLSREGRVDVSLAQGEWEIATIVPITNSTAVIGLSGKLNAGGGVTPVANRPNAFIARDTGEVLLWTSKPQAQVAVAGKPVKVSATDNIARIPVRIADLIEID